MRGKNDSYFMVLVSESIRKVLELGDIRENEENIHFNHSTVHEHFMLCHKYIPYSHQNCHFNFCQEKFQFKCNHIMKNCLFF